MRTSAALATALALTLTACGPGEEVVPTVTATPSTDAAEETARDDAEDEGTDPDGEDGEGEPRAEDALFGVDVCTALLPALDGNLDGLDRYATDEVLDALFNGGEPMADAAEVYETDDATCTIAIGDYWIDLTLLGDGHVGHRAVDFTENTSYGDEGHDGGEYDAEGIEQAAAAWRRDPNACDGQAAELPEGMGNHLVLVTDARLIVAVVCDTFAYQSLHELTFWEDEQLFSLVAEQWRGDDDLVVEPIILGHLDVDDSGRLTAFEKARGVGDCGQWSAFVERGASILALDEARVRECDDQAEYVEPEQWPLVHSRT